MDESGAIEQGMACYHAELAQDGRRAFDARPAGSSRGAGQFAAFSLFAMLTLFLGACGYFVVADRSQTTTMITHRGLTADGSHFPIAFLVYFLLSLPLLFSPRTTMGNRIFVMLLFGLFGTLSLGVALDTHSDRGAEAALFAEGGSRSTQSFPIIRAHEEHGRGVSYWATIHPYGHGSSLDMRMSQSDFYRIVDTQPKAHVGPGYPYCATFQVQTHGPDQRILWSRWHEMPSASIGACRAPAPA
ncbi:MAG: hypothetical protein JWO25_1772 [Alphaproteobacteria bacterium]|nr:hypothetical protein [Alphaproteobacteria bacterium]